MRAPTELFIPVGDSVSLFVSSFSFYSERTPFLFGYSPSPSFFFILNVQFSREEIHDLLVCEIFLETLGAEFTLLISFTDQLEEFLFVETVLHRLAEVENRSVSLKRNICDYIFRWIVQIIDNVDGFIICITVISFMRY